MATIAEVVRNAMVNGAAGVLNGGFLRLHAADHTLLAESTLGSPAFQAAAAGVAAANAIGDETDGVAGTVDHAHLCNSSGTEVATLTVSLEGGGGEIELTTLTIMTGDALHASELLLAVPAS